ncbi:restriction endonuclease [Mesorhizobium sp. AR07]|uniref:restriction endonuclease n=1 Tax=Mesorhizobium sp. AR07 TaxID=2865838 RepID=UPI002160365F|nr:restriction endonuclease [Mesorhizobium sp. AR07]UVK41818.1 restriction endonuclease [Mesorhizobium sp. AR07]
MKALVPPFAEFFVPVLRALDALGGSASIEEIDDKTAVLMDISDAARSVLVGDGPRSKFDYRCAWARSWLKNAGLTNNSERGVWALTAEGRTSLSLDPEETVRRVRRADAALRKAKVVAAPERVEAEAEAADIALKDWREQLLDILLALDPAAFERLCQRLLREAGFIKVEVTGRSGDGGIDGAGVLRVNLLSFHVLFQCKRWKGSVGAGVVRDFRGAMIGRADKGLVITTGTFTADARREAVRDGAPAIDLIDGDGLCDLLKDQKIGVRVKMVEEVTVDEAAFAGF